MKEETWETLSNDEKRKQLYLKQTALLDQFLSTGAITKEQYDKSFGDLTKKMGMQGIKQSNEYGNI